MNKKSLGVIHRKFILCYFIFSFSCFKILFGQYEDLLNNPDIPWIAEFSTEHYFSLDKTSYQYENIKLVKFRSDISNLQGLNMDGWVTNWLYDHFMEKQLECYRDSLLQDKLSQKTLYNLVVQTDTVIPFDNSDFKNGYAIVSSDLNPKDIERWRAYQIIFYNKKSTNFESRLISLAPLIRSETGKLYPLFWIKMNEIFPIDFDLNDSNIPWSILSSTRNNHLDLTLLKIKKRESNFDFNSALQEQAFNLKKPIESAEDIYGSNYFLSKEEVARVYNRRDTIVTFDLENYDEQVTVHEYLIDPDSIYQFRLIQLWYYDFKKKKLVNQLRSIAPMHRVYDDSNEYRFSRPLYYIRYD